MMENKSTHPWVKDRVIELVKNKYGAAGTARARDANEACSTGIKEGYVKYIEKERERQKNEQTAT